MSENNAPKDPPKPQKPKAPAPPPKPPEPQNVLFRGSEEPEVKGGVKLIKPTKKK